MSKFKLFVIILSVFCILFTSDRAYAAETIVADGAYANNNAVDESGIIWRGPLVGYKFYVSTDLQGLYYSKTVDGGETWVDGTKVNDEALTNNRVCNFSVWAAGWTQFPNFINNRNAIQIAWIDAVDDDVYYRQFFMETDTFGTQVSVSGMAAFTCNTNPSTSSITITQTKSDAIYIAARTGTSLSSGNRFFKSVDSPDYAVWTTQTISPTPASVQTVVGTICPANTANTADVYAIDFKNGSTSAQIWHYDSSGNSWTILNSQTVTFISNGNIMTTCAVETTRANGTGIVYFGARDEIGAGASTFYVWAVESDLTVTRLDDIFTAESNHSEAVNLTFDDVNDRLYAIYGDSNTDNISYRYSDDYGVEWSDETVVTATEADISGGVRTAPTISYQLGGGRIMPVFEGNDSGSPTIEIESSFSIEVGQPEPEPVDDDLANGIKDYIQDRFNVQGNDADWIFIVGSVFILAGLLWLFKVKSVILSLGLVGAWISGLAVNQIDADGVLDWAIFVAFVLVGLAIIVVIIQGRNSEESE